MTCDVSQAAKRAVDTMIDVANEFNPQIDITQILPTGRSKVYALVLISNLVVLIKKKNSPPHTQDRMSE